LGAALRNRPLIALLFQIERGIPPRDSVVSGNTDTCTGVTAWKPNDSASDAISTPSSQVVRGMKGGAFSPTGIFTEIV
jgi:hypothetical protein